MMNVVKLSVSMLNVVILSVIMLNAVAPNTLKVDIFYVSIYYYSFNFVAPSKESTSSRTVYHPVEPLLCYVGRSRTKEFFSY
jgi:hypothetical protein